MERDGSSERVSRHPIRVVARRTGLTLHVLRAWERRYGLVAPERTRGGQRLYSDADIARLRLLREAVDGGRSISQVARLGEGELEALVAQDREARAAAGGGAVAARPPAGAGEYVAACVAAGLRLDAEAVHRLLLRALVALPPRAFMGRVVGPLLHEVGERWHRGELMPAQEHAVSVAVGRALTFLLSAHEPERGAPVLLATTVAGEAHEFGAMQASAVAAEAGWRVLYLGPSLPSEEIARAASIAKAAVVAVSAVQDRGSGELVGELRALRGRLPAESRLVVGGAATTAHRQALRQLAGVEAHDLESFRDALPSVRGLEVGA